MRNKLAICLLLILTAQAVLAASGFTRQRRLGYLPGDQWEPALGADAHGHVYVLFPQYGQIDDCSACVPPTMVLSTSNDNGISWEPPRPLLPLRSGQFDAQIKVDPVDRQTVYVSWMQGRHDIIVGRSHDFGSTWRFAVAEHSPGQVIDKPVLAVRGSDVYVSFNHEQTLAVAASHDFGQSFSSTVVNPGAGPGWSLAAGATVDPAGRVYFSWGSYARADVLIRPVKVFISRSADGGRNWSTKLMDVSRAAPLCPAQACSAGFLASQMALASDEGGTIYALWNAGSVTGGPERIYFSSSTDRGETWSAKVDVSDAPPDVEHCFPAISAGRADDVRIAWMDTRMMDAQNHPLWNTFYRASTTGGVTWLPEMRLSGPVGGYDYILSKGFLFPFGNLFAIDIDNLGTTHVAWGEGSNYKTPGSIWYTRGE